MNADRFKYNEITDIILRSFYEAYNEFGDGFLESVYKNIEVGLLLNFGRKPEFKRFEPIAKLEKTVTPAKAGVQKTLKRLDACLTDGR